MKNYFPEGLESNIQVKNFKKTTQLRVDHLIVGSVSEELSLKTCMMIFFLTSNNKLFWHTEWHELFFSAVVMCMIFLLVQMYMYWQDIPF